MWVEVCEITYASLDQLYLTIHAPHLLQLLPNSPLLSLLVCVIQPRHQRHLSSCIQQLGWRGHKIQMDNESPENISNTETWKDTFILWWHKWQEKWKIEFVLSFITEEKTTHRNSKKKWSWNQDDVKSQISTLSEAQTMPRVFIYRKYHLVCLSWYEFNFVICSSDYI